MTDALKVIYSYLTRKYICRWFDHRWDVVTTIPPLVVEGLPTIRSYTCRRCNTMQWRPVA